MKYLFVIAVLTLGSVSLFAKDWFSIVPSSNQYIYVVALERESPDEPSNQWNPTLYKVDVREARIVDRLKIADQGAPIYCHHMRDDRIRVCIDEGIAGNGTSVGKCFTKEIVIDTQQIKIVNETIIPGGVKYEFYDRNISSRYDKFKKFGIVLGEFSRGIVFVLSGSRNERILTMFTAESQAEIQSIPLMDEKMKTGDQFGSQSGDINSAYWGDREVILLFYGNGHLGHFAPGCLAIIDVKTRLVKYVPIGSNPALGIAY